MEKGRGGQSTGAQVSLSLGGRVVCEPLTKELPLLLKADKRNSSSTYKSRLICPPTGSGVVTLRRAPRPPPSTGALFSRAEFLHLEGRIPRLRTLLPLKISQEWSTCLLVHSLLPQPPG